MFSLFCLFYLIFCTDVSLSSNGIKLYEEYLKLLGKDDAFSQIFGLRPLSELTDPILRQNQYGFQSGLWGTELLPMQLWFFEIHMLRLKENFVNDQSSREELIKETQSSYNWILSTVDSILINMNWMNLTKLCDEIRFPRCSWKYFINVVDPFGMDYNLMEAINPALVNVSIVKTAKWRDNMNLKRYRVPITLTDCYPIKSIDQASAIYIYAVCMMYSDYLESDSLRICPNPCMDFPCRSVRNADINSCQNFGIYKRDFKCSCLQGYRWDPKSLACLAENYCFSVCDRKGTMKCNFSPNLGTVECICKSGFMAFDCSVLNNACIFGDNHPSHISGIEACNVAEGINKCFPFLGTAAYSCGCTPPFVADRNLGYDNCLATLDQCSNRLCVFGSCETSPDGFRSYCQCDLDFKGDECDVPRGQWSAWSNWTICFPDCGDGSIRQRIRYCVGQIDDCIGQPEETDLCEKRICFYERPPEDITYDLFWVRWLVVTIVATSFIILVLLASSILTLFRSQKTKTQKENARQRRKLKLTSTFKRIKSRYGLAPNAANVIETLEEMWNPNADEDEMKTNLNVIYKMLTRLQRKNPAIYKTVSESSEIAALALTYNQ